MPIRTDRPARIADRPGAVDESSPADSDRPSDQGPVDESSSADSGQIEEASLEEAGRSARKADAFMDLIGVGLASADSGHAAGAGRYMVTRDGGHSYRFLNGAPVGPVDAAMTGSDRSTVSHLIARKRRAFKPGA